MSKVRRPPARGLKAFYDYAKARHLCYINKFVDPTWVTPDPILSRYSFCNVFRELDKTTKWLADNVRGPMNKARDPNLMLAVVLFRMFNRIETGEAFFRDDNLLGGSSAFDAYVRTNKVEPLRRAALARMGSKGPFVTGSYIIAGPPGMSKLDGMLKVVHWFRTGTATWHDGTDKSWHQVALMKRVSLEQMHSWLRQFDYFGVFHSYEIVTDLRWTHILGHAPDIHTWANPGPGCRRGLNRLYGRDKDEPFGEKERILEEMDFVLEAAGDYWTDFAHRMRDAAPKLKTPMEWEMRDVEHTLCEFDKYERTRAGEGRPRGKYRGNAPASQRGVAGSR
jgi:hypothetical protein